jgi:hypothetical protein
MYVFTSNHEAYNWARQADGVCSILIGNPWAVPVYIVRRSASASHYVTLSVDLAASAQRKAQWGK